MISDEITDFSRTFHDEIRAEAHALEALREEVFVQKMGDILEDYGEIETLVPCSYRATGMKVDGYCYDDEFKDFILVASYFLDETEPSRSKVTNSDVSREMKKITTFLEKCLKGAHKKIEISNEAYDLAKLIYECRDDIRNVKFVLITDGIAPKSPSEVEALDGIDVSRTVWDVERTCHFYRTGEREQISIDFSEYCGGPLQCVVREEGNQIYTTYLGFIPGKALADMYALWGIKMLDMNVRVFLSARGNVNKGIRKTIIENPEMFCAYNNGITVFARGVTLTEEGSGLVNANDFQIVNGGQTTASLYHTRKKDKADLDKVNVQMKLTVIHDEAQIDKLVPLISEYSNTQNKVQTADLAANEAPHPEIQAVSKAIPAPDPTGGSQQTYWFYERARGSYEEFRNLTAKTPAQKKLFDTLNPKKQKFDKIKFAKVWNSYLRLPHIVSMGGQKNFGRFNEWLREQKEEEWTSFFRKTVSLMILWNEMERMVRRNKFQGYHHNIVAYSLSWLFHLTDSRLDLEKIWQKQSAAESLFIALDNMSHIVNEHIRDTSLNVTEYCKKKECWEKLLEKLFALPAGIKDEYISGKSGNGYSPSIESEEVAVMFCKEKGGQLWFDLSKWLKERDFLTPKARSQCFNMGRTLQKGKEPSVILSIPCMKAWKDAEIRGWGGLTVGLTGRS
jgi:hypothetical protein